MDEHDGLPVVMNLPHFVQLGTAQFMKLFHESWKDILDTSGSLAYRVFQRFKTYFKISVYRRIQKKNSTSLDVQLGTKQIMQVKKFTTSKLLILALPQTLGWSQSAVLSTTPRSHRLFLVEVACLAAWHRKNLISSPHAPSKPNARLCQVAGL